MTKLNVKKELKRGMVEIQKPCNVLCCPKCRILNCLYYFISFKRNDKILYSKNDSEEFSLYRCHYVI